MRPYFTRTKLIRPLEALIIGACAVALAIIFNHFDAFDRLARFLEEHEEWELDEYFFVLFFGGIGALVLAVLRASDLAREIIQREEAEERAVRLARHDPLTGLANRRLLHEVLPGLLDSAAAGARDAAVLMVDLDQFKQVNDVNGHEAGDALLVSVAQRLREACGEDALIARIGGDEFVVVLTEIDSADDAARTAAAIIREVSRPYRIGTARLDVGATVGIARFPTDAAEGEELVRAADVAMYEGKRAGKGAFRFFHADMDERLRARAELDADLRVAVERDEIVAYFQPVISLADDHIIGFEALARWNHPTRGLVAPDEFIPIAEDAGLIDSITRRILREGCIAARGWHPDTTLAINISPLQLRDPWLAPRLIAILTEMGFPPQRLIVEITENAVIDDIERVADIFAALQEAGIRIALDDFGKGYSSLSHLRQLRFNHLKIDSSFVRSMDSAESQKIVSAVAGLGRALGMPVTAEGVESEEAAQKLRDLGCEQAQGYLFGAPAARLTAQQMLDADDSRIAKLKCVG